MRKIKKFDCTKCENRDEYFKCRYEDDPKCDYYKPIPVSDTNAD